MTELLEMFLLGGVKLKLGGVPLSGLASRRTEALLIYLAYTGRPHSREALANLLWEERTQSRALGNLRVMLTSLRQKLGTYVTITRQTVAFNQDSPHWLDVAALEEGLATARAQQSQEGGHSSEGVARLAQALTLYQGDFLDGFYLRGSRGFEEWQVAERERLRLQTIEALDDLVAGYLALGDYAAGLEGAQRLLQLDPLREEAHRQLMRLLAYSGRRNAALIQYETCCQILADELGVEPMVATRTLYEQIRSGGLSRGVGQEAGETVEGPRPVLSKAEGSEAYRAPWLNQDWGEAPDTAAFYGRGTELARLERWLVRDRCRLVAVLGMGGLGKTALAVKAARSLAGQFDFVFWRSLLNAPPLAEVLRTGLQFLSAQTLTDLPNSLDEQLSLLFTYLRQHRCLLVLDNVESILQSERAGYYKPGYETYGQLIRRMGESEHQSCLLLTSRESPQEVARLEGDTLRVRSLQLAGLTGEAGQEILKAHGLVGPVDQEVALVTRYSGNALALKLVARTIQELFDGDIAAFLSVETPIFDDIRDVLDQQLARLSPLEREILAWLAIEREAISRQALVDNLAPAVSQRALLEALRALQRRSLLEKVGGGFTLQNVVTEYTTDRLIEGICRELEAEAHSLPSPSVPLLNRHALLKAQAKEYVRQSQVRLILQPIAERLVAHLGRAGLVETLRRLLDRMREQAPLVPGYAAGNILNLLLHLGVDVWGTDFSRLSVWQAYLRGVRLPEINFAGADLTGSVFSNTFGFVMSVAFGPAGEEEHLAVGTHNGEIRLWRVVDGQPVGVYAGHTGTVDALAFSPDGRILASSGADQTIRLWDVKSGRMIYILYGHTGKVFSVVFSPDGRTLASGSADRTIRLWDVATGDGLGGGQAIHILCGHTGGITSVAFSPDGGTLASGSFDRTVRLWGIEQGQLRHTLQGHTDVIRAIAFSPTGETLASGGDDQTARLWDVKSGQLRYSWQGHTDIIFSVAFSPDGGTLASGSFDRTVRLWGIEQGQLRHTLQGHTDVIRAIAFSPTGETLASGSLDQTIRLWDVHTGQALNIWQGYSQSVLAVGFSPAGETLASGGFDQTVRLWDVRTGQLLKTWSGHTNTIYAIAFSPDGETLASGSTDYTVRLWDVRSGQTVHTLSGHTDEVACLAFSPDGETLASGSNDQTVRLWEAQSGRAIQILRGHTGWVNAVAFSPHTPEVTGGETLVSAGFEGVVHLWDMQRGQILHTWQTDKVWSLAFSPDGQTLAGGGDDRMIHLWAVRRHCGQPCQTLGGHTDQILSVAFSLDGCILASGSADQTVRLWEVKTGRAICTLHGHTSKVFSIAFSPTGQILASGSVDETIKLWDVRTGKCLRTLRSEGPYASMNITAATGLTVAQKQALKALGAVECGMNI